MLACVLPLLMLIAGGYPLAAALGLPWRTRMFTALALGLTGGPAIAWTTGVLLPVVRPDLPLMGLAFFGAVRLVLDLRKSKPLCLRPDRNLYPVIGAMALVAVLQCSLISGTHWSNGSLFIANLFPHDVMWHLSIAAMLRPGADFATPWPPPNPVWSDARLVNYHPLTDVLVALLAPHEAQVSAYSQVLPPLYSLLFTGGVAWVARRWGATYGEAAFTVLIAGACGSFGHLVALVNAGKPDVWDSAFWLSQPWSMCNNPPLALSFGPLMVGLALLTLRGLKLPARVAALAILWGASFGIKAYLPVLVIPSLGLAMLAARPEDRKSLIADLAGVSAGAAVMFLLTTRGAVGMLIYDPAWILAKLISQSDRLLWLVVRTHAYFPRGFWAAITFVWHVASLPLYVVGNLGVRLFGLRSAWRGVVGKAKVVEDSLASQRVAMGVTVLGLLMPLLFKQRGVEWNTIQFGYFSLAISSLWAGPHLLRWIRRPGTAWRKTMRAIVVGLLAAPTIVQSMALNRSGLMIPASEVTALRELGRQVPVGKGIVILPEEGVVRPEEHGFRVPSDAISIPYVPALSGRPAYYADPLTLDILLLPGDARRQEILQMQALSAVERRRWLEERGLYGVYSIPRE